MTCPQSSGTSTYVVWGRMVSDGYETMVDLADRWETKDDCRDKAAKDMEIEAGKQGFDAKSAERTVVRLAQAVEDAKKRMSLRPTILTEAKTPQGARQIIETIGRIPLSETYKLVGGQAPRLEDQGSDTFLGILFRDVQNGRLPYCEAKQVTPFLPDADLPTVRKEVKGNDKDGKTETYQEDELSNVDKLEGLRRLFAILRTSLLMVLDSQPQHIQLKVTHVEVEPYYMWLEGPEIARKHPPPPVEVVIQAERKAWRNILVAIYNKVSLSKAISDVRGGHLVLDSRGL